MNALEYYKSVATREIARGEFQYLSGRDDLLIFRHDTNYSYRIKKGNRIGQRCPGPFVVTSVRETAFNEPIGTVISVS